MIPNGNLYHVKNALNIEPLEYYSYLSEKPSPFYYKDTDKLDFRRYLRELGIDNVDVVYTLLGGNGLTRLDAQTLPREYYCKIVVHEAKQVVDLILDACPNAKIKVMSCQFPSVKGGLGSNYGAEPPFNEYLNLINYHMELGKAYEKWSEEYKYKYSVEYINVSGQFDSEYNFPHTDKPVSVRSKVKERFEVNGVHPLECGYYQIADAVYRNLVKEFYSER